MLDLNKIAEECNKYSIMRIKNGAKIDIDPLKACAGELIEAVEAKDNYDDNADLISVDLGYLHDDIKADYADELMDAFYCLLVACHKDGIDVEKALLKNIDKNKKRALCMGDKK